jgi:hypothetical protein
MKQKPYWFDVVTRPFAWGEIELMPKSLSKDKTKALAVAYFDARLVRRRLNEAFGPERWRALYTPITTNGLIAVQCRLECDFDGGTVIREEVGVPTDIEPVKGAYSDGIKRAFAALGNDWLYGLNLGWHPYTGKTSAPFETSVLDRIKRIYEEQVTMREREHPIVIALPEEPERAARPDKGVGAVLDKIPVSLLEVEEVGE